MHYFNLTIVYFVRFVHLQINKRKPIFVTISGIYTMKTKYHSPYHSTIKVTVTTLRYLIRHEVHASWKFARIRLQEKERNLAS